MDYNGCTDQICSDIFMIPSCKTKIRVEQDVENSLGYYYSAIVSDGISPYQYEWTLNDSVFVTSSDLKYFYPANKSMIEHIRLTTTDATGCINNVEYKVNIGNSSNCFTNFYVDTIIIVDSLDPGFEQIEIRYISETGEVWSSSNGIQKGAEFFKVENFIPYNKNELELNTMALDILFECTLFTKEGEEMVVRNGRAKIAMAIP